MRVTNEGDAIIYIHEMPRVSSLMCGHGKTSININSPIEKLIIQ